jgi:xylulokinase
VLLAHDIGTTGDKASLHDDAGRLLAAVSVAYPTRYGAGGLVEQDPRDWWNAACEATRALLATTGTPAAEISAVGLSGQMMGAVLLDAKLEPVRPSLIWADTRSGAQCRRLEQTVGRADAYRVTGHQLNPTYSLSKLMWVRDAEPAEFAAAAHFCLAKDFVVARLTGVVVTDPSDASSTNAYDQESGEWSARLLAAAELPSSLFPRIVPSTTVVGGVTAHAAERTGLRSGTPVVLGGGDGPLAAVGAGIVGPEDGAYAYLGSSSWVSLVTDQPVYDLPAMRTMSFDHVVPGRFVPTATMQAGAGSLAWIAELLGTDADKKELSALLTEAGAAAAATEGLYFLPHLLGERSPYWNPAARGAFVGLSRHHGRAQLTRAVLEGVAFNLATCLGAFADNGAFGPRGTTPERVDAIGGGARSDVWLQILADVWGCTVRRRSIVEEANSLGAAVTAGVGVGAFDGFDVARELSQVTAEFHPDPARSADYERRHAIFLDAYDRLEPWFEQAAR